MKNEGRCLDTVFVESSFYFDVEVTYFLKQNYSICGVVGSCSTTPRYQICRNTTEAGTDLRQPKAAKPPSWKFQTLSRNPKEAKLYLNPIPGA